MTSHPAGFEGGDPGFSKDDIDALVSGAGLDEPSTGGVAPGPQSPDPTGGTGPSPNAGADTSGRSKKRVEGRSSGTTQDGSPSGPDQPAGSGSDDQFLADDSELPATPFEFTALDGPGDRPPDVQRMTMLGDVRLKVKVQLGRTKMLVEDVLKLGGGSVVELDKLAGDPVDVLVNDRLIARGEVLVLNDNFCVRISEVISNDPHRITM